MWYMEKALLEGRKEGWPEVGTAEEQEVKGKFIFLLSFRANQEN